MTEATTTVPARPSPGPARPYHFPRVHRIRLESGVTLLVAPVTKLPVVTVTVLSEAGAVGEPSGKEGVGQLTASALLEGTARLSGDALAEQLERLGVAMASGADWDGAMLSATMLSSRLEDAFALLAEVLLTPAFPEREIERLKAERQAQILQQRAEPRGLADEMLGRFLYTAESRYAAPLEGNEASVSSIGPEDVAAFHATRVRPAGTTVIIVGDVTPERAEALVRARLATWDGGAPPSARADDRPARLTRAVHIVEKADAPQSELRIGHVGLPRSHPEYFPALVMNMLLGGLFSSRINLNLREAHGYTYGAFSAFDWRRGAGPFVVSSAVRSDVTAPAATEVLREIERIRSENVSPEELSLATSYLEGVFPIRFETTAAIAQALASRVMYGLPEDYFDTYRGRVRSVSRADVLRAARELLRPEELQLVVVGDPAVVKPEIAKMEFGPVTLYDTEGGKLPV